MFVYNDTTKKTECSNKIKLHIDLKDIEEDTKHENENKSEYENYNIFKSYIKIDYKNLKLN